MSDHQQIAESLGVFVVPMVLIIHTNFGGMLPRKNLK